MHVKAVRKMEDGRWLVIGEATVPMPSRARGLYVDVVGYVADPRAALSPRSLGAREVFRQGPVPRNGRTPRSARWHAYAALRKAVRGRFGLDLPPVQEIIGRRAVTTTRAPDAEGNFRLYGR